LCAGKVGVNPRGVEDVFIIEKSFQVGSKITRSGMESTREVL